MNGMNRRWARTVALWAVAAFGSVAPSWAQQAAPAPMVMGAASTWTFRLPLDASVGRCNIELAVAGGPSTQLEVAAPDFEAQLNWTPTAPGPVSLSWQGKTKFRGVRTVQACPGSGTVQATVMASSDFVRERWNTALARLDDAQKECVRVGMGFAGLLMQSMDSSARLTDPADEAMKPIYQRCDAFLAKRPRPSLECNLPNRTRSTCEEAWRTEVDGRPRRLNLTEALQATFENKPVTLALYEKADVREARERREKEAADRLAAEAAAKKEAEEAQRRWLESPEYKRQQAEAAARERKQREDEARLQAQRERERLEAERLEAERRQREEQARLRALANLKVKNVGLGAGAVPCTVDEATYVDILQKPVRLQFQCRFGPAEDQTLVIFAADRKTVVSVTRRQFLKPSDPEPGEIVKAAVGFYGPPTAQDEGNWMAIYGTPYTTSYSGRRVDLSENKAGVGLLIKGKLCGDGRFGTERCGNLGTTLIEYELVNHPALFQSYEDGKARLAAQNSARISNQKF